MTILAVIPRREQCGVTDYANHLYSVQAFPREGVKLIRRELSVGNCLKAPFSGADVIHLQHEYSIFGFAGIWGFLWLAYLALFRPFHLKLAVTIHTVYDWRNAGSLFAHRTKSRLLLGCLSLYGRMYHWLLSVTASRLIFLSEFSRARFLETTPAAKPDKMVVIPIGFYDVPIRAESTQLLEDRFGIEKTDFVATLFGFAFPAKGYHLGIEAMALLHREHPEFKLLIVSGEPAEGGGHYLDQLKQSVAKLGLGNCVRFTGYIPGDDPLLDQVLLRTDCFVYPYVKESATSGSLATTLSARKIYITSDLEMFRSFTPGIKFRAGDIGDLAAKMLDVQQMNPTAMSAYQDGLKAYLASNNTEAMRKRHLDCFVELLANPASKV